MKTKKAVARRAQPEPTMPQPSKWPLWVLLGSAIGLVLNWTLPLVRYGVDGFASSSTDAADLLASRLLYEKVLGAQPLLGHALLLFGSAVLAIHARTEKDPGIPLATLVALPTGGLLLAVSGTRWVGFALARLLEPGESLVHLQPIVLANLAAGLAVLVASTWRLIRAARATPLLARPAAYALVTAAGLLLLPLFPLARVSMLGGREAWIEEFTLAVLGADEALWKFEPATSLAAVRACLWFAFAVATAFLAPLLAASPPARRIPLPWVLRAQACALAAAVLLTVWFALRLPDLRDGTTLAPNPVLGLTLLLWALVFLPRPFGAREHVARGSA